MSAGGYAELHCLSNFSFQRGASSADELFKRAREQGYTALAITDECTLAGIVRGWQAAKAHQLRLIVGSEVRLQGGPKLVLLVENLRGYQSLCGLITRARRRAGKGEYQLFAADLEANCEGLLALWIPDEADDANAAQWLRELFGERLYLAVHLHRGADDTTRLARLRTLAAQLDIRAVACGDVHMHSRGRRALQDCMTAVRHHCTITSAGRYLFANGERHLRSLAQLNELYPADLLEQSQLIAERCHFDLSELKYQYPREVVPPGQTPASWL
ncbi:MAG: PHP domain-containing protein, partial [Pseudomonas sp.]